MFMEDLCTGELWYDAGDGIRIGKYCVLSNVNIAPGTIIGHHNVLNGCTIGEGCRVGNHNTIEEGSLIGDGVVIWHNCSIYDCTIGERTRIGSHNTIGRCKIGARCKVQDCTVICDGHVLEDETCIGANVVLCNDKYPQACDENGEPKLREHWQCQPVTIKRGASVGSGVSIAPGSVIGENALVGAGAVVFHDVPEDVTVAGNPARLVRSLE